MTTIEVPPIPAVLTADANADVPRNIGVRTVDDRMSFIASAAASLAFTWVVYENILAFSGTVGFVLFWWVSFLLLLAGVTALGNPFPAVVDRVVASIVTSGAVVVVAVLAWTIVFVIIKGWPALHHLNFYTHNMTGVRPTAPLNKGGVWFAILGSAEQVGIATAISLPLGVGTAIFLAEVGGRVSRVVRTVVEAMTALPDVLAGLFVYTLLILILGGQRDGIAVALALSVTMTPIVARSAEVVLRVVPGGLREASLALGASSWQTVWRVVLPTARSGLVTALILGVARVAGESAPLLIVSAPTTFWNADPFNQPQTSLPLFIYTQIRSGEAQAQVRGYGAAALLLILVLVLFILARLAGRDRLAKPARRPQRTAHRRSVAQPPTATGPAHGRSGAQAWVRPSANELTLPHPPVPANPEPNQ